MRVTSTAVARSLSILGHPVVVVPVAVVTLVFHERAYSAVLIASVTCGIAGVVLAFSFWQVRRGQWQHIDASGRSRASFAQCLSGDCSFPGCRCRVLSAAQAWVVAWSVVVRPVDRVRDVGFTLAQVLTTCFSSPLSQSCCSWPRSFGMLRLQSVAAVSICRVRLVLGRHTLVEVLWQHSWVQCSARASGCDLADRWLTTRKARRLPWKIVAP